MTEVVLKHRRLDVKPNLIGIVSINFGLQV